VGAYSFVMTWMIGKAIDKTMGFRISTEDEINGIDTAVHAESGYDFVGGGGGSAFAPADRAVAAAQAVGAGKGQA
jgi:Amt family ammonium transporter